MNSAFSRFSIWFGEMGFQNKVYDGVDKHARAKKNASNTGDVPAWCAEPKASLRWFNPVTFISAGEAVTGGLISFQFRRRFKGRAFGKGQWVVLFLWADEAGQTQNICESPAKVIGFEGCKGM